MKVNGNIFKGILFLMIAIFGFLITPSQVGVIAGEQINSRSFPYLILTVMAISSILLILQGVIEKDKVYWQFNAHEFKKWTYPLIVFALLLFYVLIMPTLGYVISSLITASLLLALVKCKKIPYYITSYVFVFAIYYVFTKFLLVPLPSFGL